MCVLAARLVLLTSSRMSLVQGRSIALSFLYAGMLNVAITSAKLLIQRALLFTTCKGDGLCTVGAFNVTYLYEMG
jgi:hypothetical protein